MKKIIYIAAILLILFSCSKKDNAKNSNKENNQKTQTTQTPDVKSSDKSNTNQKTETGADINNAQVDDGSDLNAVKEYTVEGKASGVIRGEIPENLKVYLVKKGLEFSDKSALSKKTDFTGEFSFSVKAPGDYQLKAMLEDISFSAAIPVKIKIDEQKVKITVPVREAMAISGRAIDALTSTPLANLFIEVSDDIDAPYQALTDADGKFEFQSIYIFNKCKLTWADKSLHLAGEQKNNLERDVLFSKRETRLDTLLPLIRMRSIEGSLINRSRADFKKTNLKLICLDNFAPSVNITKEYSMNQMDENRFAFNDIIGSKFNLIITHPNHLFTVNEEIQFDGDEIEKQLNYVFPNGKRLSGNIKDENKNPVKDVEVKFRWQESDKPAAGSVKTDANGSFDIFDIPVNSLDYIAVNTPDYVPFFAGPVNLPELNKELILKKGVSANGVIFTSAGIPYTGAYELSVFRAYDWGGEEPDFCRIFNKKYNAGDGHFTLNLFENGEYLVYARTEDGKYYALKDDAIIKDNKFSGNITLALKEPFKLSGEVKQQDNNATVSEAIVSLFSLECRAGELPQWKKIGEHKTNLSGKFEFANSTPGYYRMRVENQKFPVKTVLIQHIYAEILEPVTIYITSEISHTIKGQIKTKQGAPAEGIIAELFPKDPPIVRSEIDVSDSSGAFTFTEIESDISYILKLRKLNMDKWDIIHTQEISPIEEEIKKIDIVIDK